MNRAERKAYLRSAKVHRKLPHRLHRGGRLPRGLVGAKIISLRALDDAGQVEGGGLVIEYLPVGSRQARRAVFGFNEIGMWVEATACAVPSPSGRNLAVRP